MDDFAQYYELIEQYAALFFTPAEVAVIIGLPNSQKTLFEELIRNHTTSKIYQVYWGAYKTSEVAIRENLIDLAKAGSESPLLEVKNIMSQD